MYLYSFEQHFELNEKPDKLLSNSNINIDIDNIINIRNVPTISLEKLEELWKTKGNIVFILNYCDFDIYYILSDLSDLNEDPDSNFRLITTNNMHHCDFYVKPIVNRPDSNFRLIATNNMHHCDFYVKPIVNRFIERFQRRLRTRSFIHTITDQIQSQYHDEINPKYNVSLLEELTKLYETNKIYHHPNYGTLDTYLIQNLILDINDKVELEKKFRPGGDGFLDAKTHFESLNR